ncbi:methylated-DNA--[protein]-cysteine S-methyltransferase [Sphingomonas sp. IC081]|uniref:methylated-DNA--[protein]-cysteine S-methyltransferase n=1 Tax=Sphingomonas sp. IC081 TaxID=304378 RepID=UPI00115C0A2E|nr:methylated-DNA--[protein]-cysteine S-methyltransferase [Sphingomonas sp. IC081]QDK33908.1 cysteine methyltransferase [Sphingomonas sp. IC081]
MSLHMSRMPSPVGELTLVASDAGLVAVLWENDDPRRVHLHATHHVPLHELPPGDAHPVLEQARAQLADYFAGRRTVFDLPLDFRGTAFQQSVWQALLTIPYGETRSYRQIAEAIGRPGASRAVGAANGRNPISIIAPCHRVVGAGGALTGFAGGLEAKAFLLKLEGPNLLL